MNNHFRFVIFDSIPILSIFSAVKFCCKYKLKHTKCMKIEGVVSVEKLMVKWSSSRVIMCSIRNVSSPGFRSRPAALFAGKDQIYRYFVNSNFKVQRKTRSWVMALWVDYKNFVLCFVLYFLLNSIFHY